MPTQPVPRTMIGNAPPWAAYVAASRRESWSNVPPWTRNCSPTRSDDRPYRSTTALLRASQASLSADEPAQRGVEQALAVAADRDRHRQPGRGRRLPEGDSEGPGHVVVEVVEDEARLLRLQLVEQLAPGHRSASGRTVARRSTLTRAASSTSAVATASVASTGGGPSPRTARANVG